MNIPTANVVVSFDKEALDKLFAEGATFTNLVKGITENEDVLLFNHESNPNFIDFTHEFTGNGNRMSLSLIDPYGEFEKRYMVDNTVNMIGGYLRESLRDVKQPNELARIKAEKYSKELEEKRLKDFSEEYAIAFKKSYGKNYIYVAYGVGDNLDLWSGPHIMVLLGADIAVEGARKITLSLGAVPLTFDLEGRRGMYGEKVDINLRGVRVEVDARSDNINFDNYGLGKPIYGEETRKKFLETQYTDLFEESEQQFKHILEVTNDTLDVEVDSLYTTIQNFDFHTLITDIIRRYISAATNNPNVIVLLPDINYICRHAISQLVLEERADKGKTSPERVVDILSLIGAGAEFLGSEGLGLSPKANVAVANYLRSFTINYIRKTTDAANYTKESRDIGKFWSAVVILLNSFGLSLDSDDTDENLRERNYDPTELNWLKTQEAALDFEKRGISFTMPEEGIAEPYIDDSSDAFGVGGFIGEPTLVESLEQEAAVSETVSETVVEATRLRRRNFFACKTSNSDSGYPDYKKELMSIVNSILAGSKSNYGFQPNLYYESDTKLIKYWSNTNLRNIPLFAGSGNTIKEDIPVIIFGDENLVRTFLYGSNLKSTLEETKRLQQQAVEAKQTSELIIGDTFVFDSPIEVDSLVDQETFTKDFVQKSKELKITAYHLVPLHPYDRSVLLDITYNKEVDDIVKPKIDRIGPFGDISYIPDEFGLKDEDFDQESTQLIKQNAIPTFRYNTTNPNVLSLNFKFSKIYFSQLDSGFNKEVNKKASASLAGAMTTEYANFDFEDDNAITAYLRMRHRTLGDGDDVEKILKEELANEYKIQTKVVGDPEAAAKTAVQAYLETLNSSNKPFIKIDQLLPGNPITIMADFIEQMYRNALSLSIETLPSFHLSRFAGTLASPCLLFAQDQDILKTEKQKRTTLNSFFSGMYLIMGFSHTINAKGASSTFKLIKSVSKSSAKEEEEDSESLELTETIK
jgi:hypothetical protein